MRATRQFLHAALLGAALLCGCERGKTDRPIIRDEDVDIRVGLGGCSRDGAWTLLRLRALNRGAPFRGSARISGLDLDRLETPVIYELPLELPPQTVREVELAVRIDSWSEVRVDFSQEDFFRRISRVLPPRSSGLINVLAVCDDPMDYAELSRWLEDVHEASQKTGGITFSQAGVTTISTLRKVRSRELPAISAAYDAFGLVVLHGVHLGGAPPEVLGALREWVESGGSLLAIPGPEWGPGLSDAFLDLLGIAPVRSAPASKAPIAAEHRVGWPAGEAHDELMPAAGAELRSGGLAIRARLGAGAVTTLRVDIAGTRFPAPAGAAALYEALDFDLARALSFSGNSVMALRALENAMPDLLFGMSGFRIPGAGFMAGALAVYLIFGLLAPAYLCRKLGRRAWTFAAVTAAAGLAILAIFRFGVLSGLRAPEIEEITLARAFASGRTAQATSFLGCISPRPASMDLERGLDGIAAAAGVGGGRGRIAPILPALALGRNRRGQASPPSTVLQAGGRSAQRLGPVPLVANGMRYFRFDYELPLEGTLEIETGRQVRARNIGTRLIHTALLRDGALSRIETLSPGEQATLEYPEKEAASPGESRSVQFFGAVEDAALAAVPQRESLQMILQRNPENLEGKFMKASTREAFNACLAPLADPLVSFDAYGWNSPMAQPGAPVRPALNAASPGLLIAWREEPSFPEAAGAARRNALTIIVYELNR